MPRTQFIDDVWTFSLCYRDRYVVLWYRKLWSFRSCSSSLASTSFCSAEADPHGPVCSADHGDFAVAAYFGGRCPCCAGSCRFSGAAVEKTLALPQLQLVEKSVTFYVSSYLAVTCSVFAFGVQDSGLFWVMTSGNVPVFRACWFNTGYMSTSVYGGFWKIFIRFRPSYFSAMLGSTADSCSCVRLRRLSRFTLQKTVQSPQLQSIKVVDFFFMVHRQISMVLLFSRP